MNLAVCFASVSKKHALRFNANVPGSDEDDNGMRCHSKFGVLN
jgi:hypothetical protein